MILGWRLASLVVAAALTVAACSQSGPATNDLPIWTPTVDSFYAVATLDTPTPTASATGTATTTPSVTPTPSITPTSTPSPTGTDTPTPTNTPIPLLITTPDPQFGFIVVTAPPGYTPAPSPQPELSTCDCFGGDLLTCEDFARAVDAQSCYLRCKAIVGVDIHGLDMDGDGQACTWKAQ